LDTLVESNSLEDIVLDQANSILYATKGGNILKIDLQSGTSEDLLTSSNPEDLIDISLDPISNTLYVVSDKYNVNNIPVKIQKLPSGSSALENFIDIGDSRPSSFDFNPKDTLVTWTNFLTTDLKAVDTEGENQQILFRPEEYGFSYFELFAINGTSFIDNLVDLPSSVNYDNYKDFKVTITPNPSNGPIKISSNQTLLEPIVNIYTSQGKLIQSQKTLDQEFDLPTGHYFIQVIDEKQKLYSLEKFEVIK